MAQDIVNNDLLVRGTLNATRMNIPAGAVGNSQIDAAANIAETKLQHRHAWTYSKNGTIVAATEYIGIMTGDGEVLSVEAAITETIATGADRVASVDVQKSTGGGAFATILSATIDFDDASVLRAVVAGTIASAALVAGDILKVVITVAGAAGNQALGLAATVQVRENGS